MLFWRTVTFFRFNVKTSILLGIDPEEGGGRGCAFSWAGQQWAGKKTEQTGHEHTVAAFRYQSQQPVSNPEISAVSAPADIISAMAFFESPGLRSTPRMASVSNVTEKP
ncbi:MAG: hypothetical protein H6Q57_2282 [Geobacteraceae bacterium]|nr:hypothetical protein [Geobacteraceae bacterium]